MCKLCNSNNSPIHYTHHPRRSDKGIEWHNVCIDYFGEPTCRKCTASFVGNLKKERDADSFIIRKLLRSYGNKIFGSAKVNSARTCTFRANEIKESGDKYKQELKKERIETHITRHSFREKIHYVVLVIRNYIRYTGSFSTLHDSRKFVNEIKIKYARTNTKD